MNERYEIQRELKKFFEKITLDNCGHLLQNHINKTEEQLKNRLKNNQKLEIHSIYGGRIWTKNEDGSLSTFTVGDKLPNGEIIRRIDDENFTVSTNKKTIKY